MVAAAIMLATDVKTVIAALVVAIVDRLSAKERLRQPQLLLHCSAKCHSSQSLHMPRSDAIAAFHQQCSIVAVYVNGHSLGSQ